MTLIELVFVLATLAILTSIAVPGYRSHVLRTHRVEAKAALLDLAAAQERHYLVNSSYATQAQLSAAPPDGLGIPATTGNGRYAIAIANGANAAGFSATATATGAQAADTACASFTIDQLGRKAATRSGGGAATDCWN